MPAKQAAASNAAAQEPRKQLGARVSAETFKRMMRLKAEHGTDLQDQVQEALDDYLTKRGF